MWIIQPLIVTTHLADHWYSGSYSSSTARGVRTYQTSRAYNLAGGVTSQTYPSGHTVTYNYDVRCRQDASRAVHRQSGRRRVSAHMLLHSSTTAGSQVTQELFGTQTPLYHKLQYNIRGQLWDVRVATGSDVNGSWNRGALQFFYESTLTSWRKWAGQQRQRAARPTTMSRWMISPVPGPSTHQLYTYDSLNRLTSVAEYFVSSTPVAYADSHSRVTPTIVGAIAPSTRLRGAPESTTNSSPSIQPPTGSVCLAVKQE